MRGFLAALARHGRWKFVVGIALTVVVGLTEGAAVVLLVPVLDVIGLDTGGGAAGHAASAVRSLLDVVGLQPTIGPVLGLYVLVGVVLAMLRRAAIVNAADLQYGFSASLRRQLYEAIASSSWLFFSRQRSSDLTHVLTADVERVGVGAQQLITLMATVAATVVSIGIAVVLSPSATAAAVLGGGVLLLLLRHRTRAAQEAGRAMSRSSRGLYQTTLDHLAAMKTNKSHGSEGESTASFATEALAVRRSYLQGVRHVAGVRTWFEVGVVLVAAAVIGVAVEIAHLTPAATLLLIFVFMRLAPRLSSMQQLWAAVTMTLPAYAAVQEMQARCDAAREDERPDAKPPDLRDAITLEGVSFSYAGPAGPPTLTAVDLTLPAGSTTALVGPSGGGKSTLVDVVVGLLQPDQGRVLVDGTPLDGGAARAWRRRVGYVGQDSFMLHDTVRANLLAARPEASDADLDEALRLASADGFVAGLPHGLDTVVGDRGVLVSGGERQRLSLARALLRRPALLVLDEATSNLDPENEERILRALDGLHGRVTILLVAHRPGTAARADTVYRVEAGRIVVPAERAAEHSER